MADEPEEDLSNEGFAALHEKLARAGFLDAGFVSKGADWKFNFADGREGALRGLRDFFRQAGTDFSKKELFLLHFMLEHTNEQGECSAGDEKDA